MSLRALALSKMASIIDAADIPTISLLYKLNKLTAAAPGTALPKTLLGPLELPTPSKSLNDRVALLRGDITTLAVDAIVNAANRYLMGGGGVDGAIHRAAGPALLKECKKLDGCETGSAKMTDAYELPCRKVIHAVGPVYSLSGDNQSERQLLGCYTTSLQLAAAAGCRSVAFSSISTGVYGYPSRKAASVALSAVRKFLLAQDAGKEQGTRIEKVVFVTFEKKDVNAYNDSISKFFPPVPEKETTDETDTDAKLDAEAQAVANELPSPPTADPSDSEHVEKKQKYGDT
ncbi:hypothetical protein B0T17DRAFT_299865 [Bombardia bombarda]|uniref:Macro domain-containing protein n=1 Tax=Bombardia bombarda TaxID=252184 RepID=A0AA40C284_9PEZI|nr:hypothetical protein B0T17DRAFT_299865 [Bombardia bombarda]